THFGEFEFGPPCTESKIRAAESAIGEKLPEDLRTLYLSFDGFYGPTRAQFLWPLFADNASGLVEMNNFLRGDNLFPQELITKCIFFGDNGIGPYWGLKKDLPDKAIRWDAEWGTDFEIVGDTLLDAWLAEKKFYDELPEQE